MGVSMGYTVYTPQLWPFHKEGDETTTGFGGAYFQTKPNI